MGESSLLVLGLLFLAGSVAGTLNVLAGGGSLLTLPVLIFSGLPSVEANGTNRVAILMQNVVASVGFQRHGVVPWAIVGWAAVPATLGAVLGARLALLLGDRQFQLVLASIMIGVTVWTLARSEWKRRRKRARGPAAPTANQVRRPLLALGFFGVGVYGGFVQAGVGFLILAALTVAGLDLVRGNAVKVIAVLCFTVLALLVFAVNGQVVWMTGFVLGLGNSVGALLGVRWTVLKGHIWLERVVAVTVVAFALALWIRA